MSARRLSRPFCTDLGVAERREWLLANGRGSYAMGTVAGTLTRRYHGLLVAALEPPVARRMLVPAVQIVAECDGAAYELGSNRWASGMNAPQGWRYVSAFAVIDGVPTWTYALGDIELEVALAMPYGRDETAIALRVVRAPAPVGLTLRLLAADRDHHGGSLPDPAAFAIDVNGDRATIALPACGRMLHVAVPDARLVAAGDRWTGFYAEREAERGLDPIDDYLHALDARFALAPGASGGMVVGLTDATEAAPAIVAAARRRAVALAAGSTDPLLGELAIAADQFVVSTDAGASRTTIVAGYPWFSDWGRDTMIALPGLTIACGRSGIAAAILRSFAPFVSEGMLPNVFPDGGSAPEYNTVDAALWYVEAVRQCVRATRDAELARDLFPVVQSIVEHYTRGTRFGIGVDPADGLVRAGEAGVQLTWMDAKVGDFVVTPRIGKPVEVNALWYAALTTAASLAEKCGAPAQPYEAAAARVAASFGRFWNASRGACFDVIDGPEGDDPSLRPNQLFAPALSAALLGAERSRAVVDVCARELVTPVGVRTLAPSDRAYVGAYGGDQHARDCAYHQGTVWPWLIGPFVRAHLNVYHDPPRARAYVDALRDALDGYAVGTLGEIFAGDAPHVPAGTIAQAWSVAEMMTAYVASSSD
jgi:predicted glycogen debranching enzyme